MPQKFVLMERLFFLLSVLHVRAVLSRDICSWKVPSLPCLPRSCFNARVEDVNVSQQWGSLLSTHRVEVNCLFLPLLCELKNVKKFQQLATKFSITWPALLIQWLLHICPVFPAYRMGYVVCSLPLQLLLSVSWAESRWVNGKVLLLHWKQELAVGFFLVWTRHWL